MSRVMSSRGRRLGRREARGAAVVAAIVMLAGLATGVRGQDPTTGAPAADIGASPSPSTSPCPGRDLVEGSSIPGASEGPTAPPDAVADADCAPVPDVAPEPAVRPGPMRVKKDVPFMRRAPCARFARGCVNVADIYHPQNAGAWPTVITVHGRPRPPSDMKELAEALARKGAVVYNVDYRGVRPISQGFPMAINDVACAVRFARASTARYGGDPEHVVLVGHSQGGYVSALVALAGDEFPGRQGDCLAEEGDPLPEGLVHLAGVSTVDPDERFDLDHIWFGGSQERKAAAWRKGDIFQQIGGNPDLVVGIIFERHDPVVQDVDARYLQLALATAGYDSTITELLEGRTHFDVLDMDTRLGRKVLARTWEIVQRSDPHAP